MARARPFTKISAEQRSYNWSTYTGLKPKCPYCHKRINAKYYLDGKLIEGIATKLLLGFGLVDIETTAQCPICRFEWHVFQDASGLITTPASRRIEFEETGLVVEPYRDTDRFFDNREGSTPATQRVAITEHWTQVVQLAGEQARTTSSHVGVGSELTKLEVSAEEALRSRYDVSANSQRTYTDELTFDVPPKTLLRLRLPYRRVFQTGIVRGETSDGTSVELPYKVAVALEMDWSKHDTPSTEA